MNGCKEVQGVFAEYLDGRLNGRQMHEVAAHLDECQECALEWRSLCDTQRSLSLLGPAAEPADLLLRIRVAVSQEQARSRRNSLERLRLVWKNTVGPFVLQAAAGFASAVLFLGTVVLLVTMFAKPRPAQAGAELPLGDVTTPRLLYLSTDAGANDIEATASPLMVEAYVNDEGEVYDYRILSGPTDAATRAKVENLLLFSVFEPAKVLGQPVRGLAVLAFSRVAVRG
jgi:hypothetical protein